MSYAFRCTRTILHIMLHHAGAQEIGKQHVLGRFVFVQDATILPQTMPGVYSNVINEYGFFTVSSVGSFN